MERLWKREIASQSWPAVKSFTLSNSNSHVGLALRGSQKLTEYLRPGSVYHNRHPECLVREKWRKMELHGFAAGLWHNPSETEGMRIIHSLPPHRFSPLTHISVAAGQPFFFCRENAAFWNQWCGKSSLPLPLATIGISLSRVITLRSALSTKSFSPAGSVTGQESRVFSIWTDVRSRRILQ